LSVTRPHQFPKCVRRDFGAGLFAQGERSPAALQS
jgi:hypothetical protein